MTYGPLQDQVSDSRKSASLTDPELDKRLERAYECMKADFSDLGCLSPDQVAEIQSLFSIPWISHDMQKGLGVPSSQHPNEMYRWVTNRYKVGDYPRTGVTTSGTSSRTTNNNRTTSNNASSPSTSSPKLQDIMQIIMEGVDGISLNANDDPGEETEILPSDGQHDHQPR